MPTNRSIHYKSDDDLFGKNSYQFNKSGTDTRIASSSSLVQEKQHKKFLQNCLKHIIDKVFETNQRVAKVVEYHEPDELKILFDFQLPNEPQSHAKLIDILDQVIRYSVKIGHPYFLNQLFSSVDPYGLVGQCLSDALNPSVYTYEVAPLFTLMEEEVLTAMRKIVGFEKGSHIVFSRFFLFHFENYLKFNNLLTD